MPSTDVEFYGGVAHVTVPDCLKQGVLKCHLYDPDLNPGYVELAAHYGTAVVPARAGHAKDKAIVEGLVKILMRYVRFRHRHQHFTSLSGLNIALRECVERINSRDHSRFGVSRRERFESVEKAALKPLPITQFDVGELKTAKLHPDCYTLVDKAYYSAPHIHRGKQLRVKLTEQHVEIFLDLERLAFHPRCRSHDGRRMKIDAHFPPVSQAYYEATPQKLLSQSLFIHLELNRLVVDLFNIEVYGNIRHVQGLIRSATKELQTYGREQGGQHIEAAISQMRHVDKVRVPYFQMLLAEARQHKLGTTDSTREIARRPGNPMLRYIRGGHVADDPTHPNEEKLKL